MPRFSVPDLSHSHEWACIPSTKSLLRRFVWRNVDNHSIADIDRKIKQRPSKSSLYRKGTGEAPVRVIPSHYEKRAQKSPPHRASYDLEVARFEKKKLSDGGPLAQNRQKFRHFCSCNMSCFRVSRPRVCAPAFSFQFTQQTVFVSCCVLFCFAFFWSIVSSTLQLNPWYILFINPQWLFWTNPSARKCLPSPFPPVHAFLFIVHRVGPAFPILSFVCSSVSFIVFSFGASQARMNVEK